jgi:hypothetical protein
MSTRKDIYNSSFKERSNEAVIQGRNDCMYLSKYERSARFSAFRQGLNICMDTCCDCIKGLTEYIAIPDIYSNDLHIMMKTLNVCNEVIDIKKQFMYVRIEGKYARIDRMSVWMDGMYRMTACKYVNFN